MKILTVADAEERCLWDCYDAERFADVDLILSAGDLDADYLEFLSTVVNKPLFYVRGNHDDAYAKRKLGGCICVEDSVYVWCGLRIAGLGGSMRYRGGLNMFTEREMARRVRRIEPKIRFAGGVDILLTHAPIHGVGDLDDLAHRGFECLGSLVERWSPDYMVHGHVHRGYTPRFERVRELPCGTKVVNACGYHIIELDESRYVERSGWRTSLLNADTLRADNARQPGTSAMSFESLYW